MYKRKNKIVGNTISFNIDKEYFSVQKNTNKERKKSKKVNFTKGKNRK